MPKVKATIDFLRKRIAARAAGFPVYLTTDPAWLVNEAINRRAGWIEDDHWRGTVRPVAGKLPRFATGDAQRHLGLIAQRVNTPRLIVRLPELGEWRSYLQQRIPARFATE